MTTEPCAMINELLYICDRLQGLLKTLVTNEGYVGVRVRLGKGKVRIRG